MQPAPPPSPPAPSFPPAPRAHGGAATPTPDEGEVFRSLHQAYPDGLLVVSAVGTVVLANAAAEALFGYPALELIGMSVDRLLPEHLGKHHAALRQGYLNAPRHRPMGAQLDLVARRRDGREVMVEISLSPLHSQGHDFVVAAVRNIEDYPRVKQAMLRARHAELLAQIGRVAVDSRDPQALIDQAPAVAAQALQADTALLWLTELNRAGLHLASRHDGPQATPDLPPPPPPPSGTETDPAPPPPAPLPQALAQRVLALGQPLSVPDLHAQAHAGDDWACDCAQAGYRSALAVPVSDRGRPIGVLAVLSRHPQRQGDEEIRFLESLSNLLGSSLQRHHSEEALHHSQRLESVGQLTGGIAHDFNNLLTVIQGNLQVLQDRPGMAEDAAVQGLLGAALRATRRGAELTGKLLAFSRRQLLSPTEVDVGELLQSLASMLRRTLDKRIRIEVDAPPALIARADAGQLEAALLNIAINARDAMPDGGTLRFRAQSCAAPPPGNLDGTPPQDSEFVAIAVEDSGHGMPDAVKERAFEPFFTTKGSGRGTGLGLSTVYGFVQQSNGTVTLSDAVGHGTVVTLFLPAVQAQAAAVAEDEIAAPLAPGVSVLLVEDDAEVRQVILAFLLAAGCSTVACASGEEALQQLRPDARFDVLVSDIALGPGMRGTELAQQVQALRPELAILLMSGNPVDLLSADSVAPPSWELLGKPCSQNELRQAVARALAQARKAGAVPASRGD